jgi:hypothetical protein
MLKLYKRIISPLLPPVCRFYPTCSDYAIEAITTYGIFKGLWLSLKRILRCNPFHKCDYDPVPERKATFISQIVKK